MKKDFAVSFWKTLESVQSTDACGVILLMLTGTGEITVVFEHK